MSEEQTKTPETKTPETPKDKKETTMPETKQTLPSNFKFTSAREPKHADGTNHGWLWAAIAVVAVIALGGLVLGTVNFSKIGTIAESVVGHSDAIAALEKENGDRKTENEDLKLHVDAAENNIAGLKNDVGGVKDTVDKHGIAITDLEKRAKKAEGNIVWLTKNGKENGRGLEKVNGTLGQHDQRLDNLEQRPVVIGKANTLSNGPAVLYCAGSLSNRFGCLTGKPVDTKEAAIKLACGSGGSKNYAEFKDGVYGEFVPAACN